MSTAAKRITSIKNWSIQIKPKGELPNQMRWHW